MAMHLHEVEKAIKERKAMLNAIRQESVNQAQEEEERLLRRAIEESLANDVQDPSNPDVDRMTYEQLLELGENAGTVSRGCTKEQINGIKSVYWRKGRTKTDECLICIEKYTDNKRVKRLGCGHEYDAECIDKWLLNEKRCPVCSEQIF